MTPIIIVALLPLFVLGGVVSVIAGGGLGILLVTALGTFLDARDAIVLTSILVLATQSGKIYAFYHYIRWDIVRWYALPGIPASMLAAQLLFLLPSRVPQIGIGLLAVLFVMMHVFKLEPKLPPTRINIFITGLGNGLMAGFLGGSAVVRNAALLSMGFSKEVFVGTSAICALLLNIGRLTTYIPNQEWSTSFTTLIIFGLPSILFGVTLGRKFLVLINPKRFEQLLLCVILLGGLNLLFFP